MKRTVSPDRAPQYPTASVDPDYFRKQLSEAQSSLEERGFDQAFRLQLNVTAPPIDYVEEIVDELDSNSVYAIIDGSNGDYRSNEQIILDYDLNVPNSLNETLEGIDAAVEDAGFEEEFWKINGVYTPMERAHSERIDDIVDYAQSMQIHPNLLVDAGLESSITIGWFSKAPLSNEAQFGYRALPNREFQGDVLQSEEDLVKILERLTGDRENERNKHTLSKEETEKLQTLEESMNKHGIF